MEINIFFISSSLGAGTLKLIHLDLMGEMSLWMFLQTRIILQDDIYFSIVLLNEP